MNTRLTRRSVLLGTAATAGAALVLPDGRLWAEVAPAARTNHALLVAVTEYPNLWQSEWLIGPNNDAIFVRDYLLNDAPLPFAPENIAVLATGLDISDGEPELAPIRAHMKRLAETVEPGDFVYLHFAGHGIEQPAREPENELDGRDQVFMPKDVQRMTRALGHWPNGYVDKDIRDDIAALRDRGALVWAVFDCCHSATITRNLEVAVEGEKSRKVNLADYDIPDDMWQPATTRSTAAALSAQPQTMFGAVGTVGADDGLPPMVAFFASQKVEETPELPLPRDSEERVQLGLFSFTLLTQLRTHPGATYMELGQAIHHAYMGMGRSRPTPLYEGALDNRVFSTEPRVPLPQWRIRSNDGLLEIGAGQMFGIAPRTRLAVLPGPATGGMEAFDDALASAIGVVEVGSASATTARLRAVQSDELGGEDPSGLPALAPSDIPDNAYALLIEQVVDFELAVAPPRLDGPHTDRAAEIAALLDQIARDDELPMRLRIVDPGADADIRFDIRSESEVATLMQRAGSVRADDAALIARAAGSTTPRLWMMDASSSLTLRAFERPHSLDLGPDADRTPLAWLRESLSAVYRATNLARLGGENGFGSDVTVRLTRGPLPADYITPPADGAPELLLHRHSVVTPGEAVYVEVENHGTTAVDVNLLYIDSNYGITWVPMDFDGDIESAARLRARGRNDPPARYAEWVVQFEPTSFGRERIVVVVTGAPEGENPQNLRFLAQPGLTRSLGGTPGTGLTEMLEQMAGGAATRGTGSVAARRQAAARERGAVLVYSVDLLPEA